MKKVILTSLICSSILFSCYVDNNSDVREKPSIEEIKSNTEKSVIEENSLTVRSLISKPNPNQELITKLGSPYNLDILNGFRGLVFGLNYELLKNDPSSKIDKTYTTGTIKTVKYGSYSIDLFKGLNHISYTNVELLFFNERLSKIIMTKTETVDFDKGLRSYDFYIDRPFKLLVEVFGEPNIYKDVRLNQKANSIFRLNYRTDTINCIWESSKVRMEYRGTSVAPVANRSLTPMINRRDALGKVIIELMDTKVSIDNIIKYIDDNIKRKASEEEKKQLLDKF